MRSYLTIRSPFHSRLMMLNWASERKKMWHLTFPGPDAFLSIANWIPSSLFTNLNPLTWRSLSLILLRSMKRANLSPAWKSVVFIVLFSSPSLLKTSSHISPVSIPWLQTLFGIPLTITFNSEIKCLLTVSSTSDMWLVKKKKSLHWSPWNIAAHIDGRAWSLIYWDYLEMSDALGCKPHRARPRRGRSRSGKIWMERVHGKTEAKPEVLRKMKDNRQTKIRIIPLC